MAIVKTTKSRLVAGSTTLLFSALLSGCFGSGDKIENLRLPIQTSPLSAKMLDQAASFLGAATGKESPLTIDNVVFVNSVLGINNVEEDPLDLYGDLWVLLRDEYGAPILDANGCVQPLSSEPVAWPDTTIHDTLPMVLEEFQDGEFKCTVVEGYEQYTQELEIGRLNMVRTMGSNPDVFARALEEAINDINGADAITTDAAGRLVMIHYVDGVPQESTIDAPRENLALYMALLKEGRIAGYGPEKHEGGDTIPPQWLEIRADLPMGLLYFLRDGIYRHEGGVPLINGYADLSLAVHSRQYDYGTKLIDFIQYVDEPACYYLDMQDFVWSRVFNSVPNGGVNIDGFTKHADDAREVIVFMHDVIQDVPETALATLPTPAGSRINSVEKAAASFLGGASNKGVPLTVDGLVFINSVLGLNDVDFSYKGEIYGDLWELVRNDNGEPILDINGCPQPVASETITWPDTTEHDTVPMELDETSECVIVEGYENYVVEIELGRLNGARVALTNPRILDHALNDVINTINASQGVKLDIAGRLAYTVLVDGQPVDKTIDSPRAGLALYWALMKWGKLEGSIEVKEEGAWVTKNVSITLDDAVLDAQGLGYLKHGSAACQLNSANCGIQRLPSGYVDYTGFAHNSFTDFGGININFVERQDDVCGYVDKTESLWERVLDSDNTDYTNIAGVVAQAEATRKIIQFTHTVIQDPVAP